MTVKAQKLSVYEGKVEVGSELKITKTGDGLSKPLSAEPRAWESGTRLPVLLWVDVKDLTHRPAKEGVGWIRVHVAPAVEGYVLDRVEGKLLDDLVESQREAVRLWELEQQRIRDEAKGELALDGLHKGGPVDGGEPIETREVSGDGTGEALPEISDSDWEAGARAQGVSTIGSKQARKAKG